MGLVSSYLIQIFNAGVMNEPLLSGFQQVTRPGCSDLDFSLVLRLFHLKFIYYADIHIPAQRLPGHLHLTSVGPEYPVTPCPAGWISTDSTPGRASPSKTGIQQGPANTSLGQWSGHPSLLQESHIFCAKPKSPVFWKKCSRIQYFSKDSHPWFQNFLQEMGKKFQNTILEIH